MPLKLAEPFRAYSGHPQQVFFVAKNHSFTAKSKYFCRHMGTNAVDCFDQLCVGEIDGDWLEQKRRYFRWKQFRGTHGDTISSSAAGQYAILPLELKDITLYGLSGKISRRHILA